jgi:hypothetical protein
MQGTEIKISNCCHLLNIVILSEDFASLRSEVKPQSKDPMQADVMCGLSRHSHDAANAKRVHETPRHAACNARELEILRLRERVRARFGQDDKAECSITEN